jgi:sigma-B regulation protein RsbU (phosphoserine phosphatase)
LPDERIVSIVDDEMDSTKLFNDALCGNIDGTRVITFNDPIIALQHFTENKENYALVISDLKMPNLNGLELLKKIKKLDDKVRTMLINAHEIENDVVFQHCLQLGIIDSYIPKPVTVNQLCQKVRDEFLVYQLAVNLK